LLFELKESFPAYYRYYGRRISKRLSPSLNKIFENNYKNYSIDEDILKIISNQKIDKKYNLSKDFKKHIIEIGFGDGDNLLSQTQTNKDTHYIGCEVFINGLGKVLKKIIDLNLNNIKLCGLNCLYLLNNLQDSSIDQIFIINPDPWEKKRHFKRRLINKEFISLLYKKIKKGGSIIITTDSSSYYNDMSEILKNKEIEFEKIQENQLKPGDKLYDISKYQKKGILKGRKIHLVELSKI
jgi:tRNA (guanine-N7-)-methyltransferase